MSTPLLIGLSAVMVAIDSDTPRILTIRREKGRFALPFGAFDPENDRTFDLSLCGWVKEQTGLDLGYVEQLYTFGNKDRDRPEATLQGAPANARVISVGYLALTPETANIDAAFQAEWQDCYRFFPWEDHRAGRPAMLDELILPALTTWAVGNEDRMTRARLAFGFDGEEWIEERVLERYELLYEAGLVAECARDIGLPEPDVELGVAMASDHRRILATAIARLRGKLKYRPVVFELMPEQFTLSHLQRVVEALLGLSLHKQNFRRALDRTELVEGTGEIETSTGGRPAELYRYRREAARRASVAGLSAPRG